MRPKKGIAGERKHDHERFGIRIGFGFFFGLKKGSVERGSMVGMGGGACGRRRKGTARRKKVRRGKNRSRLEGYRY